MIGMRAAGLSGAEFDFQFGVVGTDAHGAVKAPS